MYILFLVLKARKFGPKGNGGGKNPRTMKALKNNELEFVKGKDGKL